MFYAIKGSVRGKYGKFVVLENSGFSFRIFSNQETVKSVSENGITEFFCATYFRDDVFEIYGFLNEPALKLFELLTGISGVGPKSALSIFDIDSVEHIIAAILEKRVDIISKASGIGKKTAERVIIELENRLESLHSGELVKKMDLRLEIEEALVSLGYQNGEAKNAVRELEKINSLEGGLREALKILGKQKNTTRR